MMRAFAQRLREPGAIDGDSVAVHCRNANGEPNRIDRYAADLMALDPTVIVADPPYDVETPLATPAPEVGAVMTLASPVFFRQRNDLFAAAARHRRPVSFGVTMGVAEGAPMGYDPSFPAAYARGRLRSTGSSKACTRVICRSSNLTCSSWRSNCAWCAHSISRYRPRSFCVPTR